MDEKNVLGAIIGDIVGSRFEFNNINSKDFDLFDKDCRFTDDTVLTVAVAEALDKSCEPNGRKAKFRSALTDALKSYGRQYPYAGYGKMFNDWLCSENSEPYNSYGNGSAMRVSPIGYFATSLKEAKELAEISASVTHNHPQGIKGAVCTVGAVYLARKNATKEKIRSYAKKFYDIDFTLDEWRDKPVIFDATCEGTVPVAIVAFLESTGFEDAIRNAISVGGDSDTIAAITGGIAGAFYGVPREIIDKAEEFLPREMSSVLDRFEFSCGLNLMIKKEKFQLLSGAYYRSKERARNKKLDNLSLGKCKRVEGRLKVIDFDWDIHWQLDRYFAMIIRDYLEYFAANSPAVGNLPEYEGLPVEASGKLWKEKVLSVAREFDRFLKFGEERNDYDCGFEPERPQVSGEEWENIEKERLECINRGFDTLKEIFTELMW